MSEHEKCDLEREALRIDLAAARRINDRQRADQANRDVQHAERQARNTGTTGCQHGHPLGGSLCPFCRQEQPA